MVPPLQPPATAANNNLPVIIYFHGGGFATSAPDSTPFDSLARRFSQHFNSVNYRLAPEHRCSSQYDDGFDAVKFLDSSASNHILPPGADLGRCFLTGDSSGGNLLHHVAVRACEHSFERVRLRGLIALQPFFGGEERTESEIRIGNGAPGLSVERADWYWKAFLPEGSDRDSPYCNVFGPNSGLKLPDSLVVVGGSDPVRDWQKEVLRGVEECRERSEVSGISKCVSWVLCVSRIAPIGFDVGWD